jgi:hypothetical protein
LRTEFLSRPSHSFPWAGDSLDRRDHAGSRGANLAKRIMSEVEVGFLIRAALSKRDRVLLEVIYAGGPPPKRTVALTWADVLPRDDRVQLSILGKGGKVRQVLLPDIVSRSLLSLRGDAGTKDPIFGSRKGGHLTERAVNGMVKRTARKAGINEAVSPHWLRHAHGSPMPSTAAPLCPRCSRRWARQHRHHVRLPARAAQYVERPAPGSGSFFSMKNRARVTWGCKDPIAETFVMPRGVVVASVLVMGGMLVGGQPAAAAPALPADQALRGEVIVRV